MIKSQKIVAPVLALAILLLAPGSSVAGISPRGGAVIAEEVQIPSEPGVILAGTLIKPRGWRGRPLPVVVTIAGTGPWVRRGMRSEIRRRLLDQGIATLEYDKRGVGKSTGAFVDTLPAMQRDVSAAIAFLRGRRDVDATRIALMGRSQGAVAAPAVAAEMPDIAAVVMLSGPVGAKGELFLGILKTHLVASGKSGAAMDEVLRAAGAWMEARGGKDHAEVTVARGALTSAFAKAGFTRPQAEDFVATLDTPVVLSMYEAAPDRALARVRAPVLVVYGTKDELIAPALQAPAAERALSANPDAMVVVIPGLDHLLARLGPEGKPVATSSEDPTAPAAVDLVVGWLSVRLRAFR